MVAKATELHGFAPEEVAQIAEELVEYRRARRERHTRLGWGKIWREQLERTASHRDRARAAAAGPPTGPAREGPRASWAGPRRRLDNRAPDRALTTEELGVETSAPFTRRKANP